MVDSASRVLVMGTTLATYSAFRLIKAAREAKKPVLMITQGPTRADDVPGVEKMDVKAGPIVRATLESILRYVVANCLLMGVIAPKARMVR